MIKYTMYVHPETNFDPGVEANVETKVTGLPETANHTAKRRLFTKLFGRLYANSSLETPSTMLYR